MRFVYFPHSLASDWNHGNAHFLRGVLSELASRGHAVDSYEQRDNWSRWHLAHDHGGAATRAYLDHYPELAGVEHEYPLPPDACTDAPGDRAVDLAADALDLGDILATADVVIVHEWNPPSVVAAVGAHHKTNGHYRLLFHDTHHRVVSEPAEMARFDLSGYDGVLAFGDVLRRAYASRGRTAWTWHEAADIRRFRPLERDKTGDLCWVGNWGDDERTAELHEFLLNPAADLKLDATVHGVRYPGDARAALKDAGIKYGGYLPNFAAPELFARHKTTVHVPRRFYVSDLPGIPTIRPFEALACGLPLVCSPWDDAENLFAPGRDYLVANDGREMCRHLAFLRDHPDAAAEQAERGLLTIRSRHTCGHRVDELMAVLGTIG